MRMYFFNNHYLGLASVQHGIQGMHSMGEIIENFEPGTPQYQAFRNWLRAHKTVIILNGGYAVTLAEVFERLKEIAADWDGDENCPALAFAKFHEEVDALNGALTSVAVVVPAGCYSERDRASRLAMRALKKRADDLDYLDAVEAAGDRDNFTVRERLALLCAGFPLA